MIRTYKYKLLVFCVAFVTITTSCKKSYLEQTPPTSLTPEIALAAESDLSTALLGAYASTTTPAGGLRYVDFYGRTVPVLGDIMADNAYQSLTNSNRYTVFNLYTFTVADANVSGFWNSAYGTILRCNNIINSKVASSINVDQYKGEAYAIRALCYFTLVRYFAKPFTDNPSGLGVPIVTEYNTSLYPARNTVSEVYTLINNDLTKAFTLMTLYKNSTQFSKYAARGLQAKVYLTMGDYANAKTAALDVINSGVFTLASPSNYISYWNTALPRTDKLETLFEVSSDAISNNGFDALPNIYAQTGYGDLLCADDLYALFGSTDVRKGLYSPGTRGGLAGVFINKFSSTYGTDISDTKVLRLSEMYLIAAEASVTTLPSDALKYVNILTAARNAAPIISTGAQLFEDIITERRKELAFEGDRYNDLQRLKRDITRSINYPAAIRSIPYSNFRRLLPIPQTELDANVSIRSQQNSGY